MGIWCRFLYADGEPGGIFGERQIDGRVENIRKNVCFLECNLID